ncbi:MAG: biotin--[acetyl-CoA-carboxylase] ligase [Pseudomonadota bacterium]
MTTRNALLSMLKTESGKWISGEVLCKKLNISRAAVSKHMRILKDSGYKILSSTKKGYHFSGILDKIIKDEITDNLQTKIFGKKKILILAKTDSTNIQARLLAQQGAPQGSVVIAEDQSHGRGRKDRQWFSLPEKSIMMSLILRPTLPPEKAPRITLLAAVAAAKALINLTDLNIRIKWPNDILVGNKKLAGISTGLSTDMDTVNYVILGIGLNVGTRLSDFPDELQNIATSIMIESGQTISRVKIIKEFLFQFETYYDILHDKGFEPILAQWKELADITDKRISIALHDKTISGIVLDIDHDGVLILQTSDKTIHRILSGDVSLLDG